MILKSLFWFSENCATLMSVEEGWQASMHYKTKGGNAMEIVLIVINLMTAILNLVTAVIRHKEK